MFKPIPLKGRWLFFFFFFFVWFVFSNGAYSKRETFALTNSIFFFRIDSFKERRQEALVVSFLNNGGRSIKTAFRSVTYSRVFLPRTPATVGSPSLGIIGVQGPDENIRYHFVLLSACSKGVIRSPAATLSYYISGKMQLFQIYAYSMGVGGGGGELPILYMA